MRRTLLHSSVPGPRSSYVRASGGREDCVLFSAMICDVRSAMCVCCAACVGRALATHWNQLELQARTAPANTAQPALLTSAPAARSSLCTLHLTTKPRAPPETLHAPLRSSRQQLVATGAGAALQAAAGCCPGPQRASQPSATQGSAAYHASQPAACGRSSATAGRRWPGLARAPAAAAAQLGCGHAAVPSSGPACSAGPAAPARQCSPLHPLHSTPLHSIHFFR